MDLGFPFLTASSGSTLILENKERQMALMPGACGIFLIGIQSGNEIQEVMTVETEKGALIFSGYINYYLNK